MEISNTKNQAIDLRIEEHERYQTLAVITLRQRPPVRPVEASKSPSSVNDR